MNPLPANISHASTRASYDRLSGIYDWLAASEQPFRRRAVAMLAARPGERVLEIGCGTGESLGALGQMGLSTLGVDLSWGMLRRAAGKPAVRSTARLCAADALQLPVAAQGFDAVLLVFTLELFADPEIPLLLGEIQRVLRPGGRLCAAALALTAHPGWMARAYIGCHEHYPQWADCRPIPARALVEQSGLAVREDWHGSLWGLPVEIVLAVSGGPQEVAS